MIHTVVMDGLKIFLSHAFSKAQRTLRVLLKRFWVMEGNGPGDGDGEGDGEGST